MECVIPSFSLKCIAVDNKQHHQWGKDPLEGGGGEMSGAMQSRGVLSLGRAGSLLLVGGSN